MPPTPRIKNDKHVKNVKMEIFKKLIILEGFMQNGHHHLFQRIFLRIIAPVKIDFRHFFEYYIFLTLESLKTIYF